MIRKKKLYSRPKKLYEKSRIEEENKLIEKYGLKNKREIWKTLSKLKYYRNRAKALAYSSREEQEVLFNKLRRLNLKINSISDILALKIENLLDRRLQTLVFKKKLANTIKHARQLIAHKKVLIGSRVVNVPGYLVSLEEENKISLKENKKKGDKKVENE